MKPNTSEQETRGQKTDLRIIKTKKAIAQAFRKTLLRIPYEKITVSLISAQADVSRKTFYSHFDSLDDLVYQTVATTAQGVIEDYLANNPEPTYRGISRAVSFGAAKNLARIEPIYKNLSYVFTTNAFNSLVCNAVIEEIRRVGHLLPEPEPEWLPPLIYMTLNGLNGMFSAKKAHRGEEFDVEKFYEVASDAINSMIP